MEALTPETLAVLSLMKEDGLQPFRSGSLKSCIKLAKVLKVGTTYSIKVRDNLGNERALTSAEVLHMLNDPSY